MEIIRVLIALATGKLGLKIMNDKARISNSEFAVLSVIALVCVSICGWWFVDACVTFRQALGLDPVPEFLLKIYTREEVSLLPVLDGAVLYSYIVMWLKLKNYPEWLNPKDLAKWRRTRLSWYLVFLLLISAALLWYLNSEVRI